jgi:dipeptidase E
MHQTIAMLDILSIGGGDLGETESLDRLFVSRADKARPRLLFIPTASRDSEEYIQSMTVAYGCLGCDVEPLRLWSDPDKAFEKIDRADLIYVGGGNTKDMLKLWTDLQVDQVLRRVAMQGKPVGGISAGAICWYRVGNSDWPQYEGLPRVKTARLDCLALVDLVLCPHASREEFRMNDFREMMRGERGPGIALDDCCAIHIRGGEYRIISSEAGAVAHLIEWVEGDLHERTLTPSDSYRPVSSLRFD